MSHLSDEPIHQHSAQRQEQHARTNKSCSDEEIIAFPYLEPSCFRKWDVSGQKHQCKQRRNGNIKHLSDRFCQAFRCLRYQAFWKSHRCSLKFAAKIQNLTQSPSLSGPPKPDSPQSPFALHKRLTCASFQNRFLPLWI